jgi:hypothetical protein
MYKISIQRAEKTTCRRSLNTWFRYMINLWLMIGGHSRAQTEGGSRLNIQTLEDTPLEDCLISPLASAGLKRVQ